MIRSKFIPVILAAFCGLAAQFQASRANAQTVIYQSPWSLDLFQGVVLNEGEGACSGSGYCLWMWGPWGLQGNLQFFDPNGNLIWQSPIWENDSPNAWASFQSDGNLVVYTPASIGSNALVNFATNTYAGNTATGWPGGVIVIQEFGYLEIYDVNWNFLGCLYCNGEADWGTGPN
jgi:hypothetical protein